MGKKNSKSIIFLHEGYTEREFYDQTFELYLPKRGIRIFKYNLKGIFNLNKKVVSKLNWFLCEKDKSDQQEIYVFVAYDREGDRNEEPLLDLEGLNSQFVRKKSRIRCIDQILATQDLESWFFHDLEGIYNFLKVPEKKRTLKVHNVEKFTNRSLAQLFKTQGRIYYKRGKRVEGFIDSLDLKKIYESSPDLQNGIEKILELF